MFDELGCPNSARYIASDTLHGQVSKLNTIFTYKKAETKWVSDKRAIHVILYTTINHVRKKKRGMLLAISNLHTPNKVEAETTQ